MLKLENLDKINQPYRDRVCQYIEALYDHFGKTLSGIIIFGSVARGEERIDKKYESDVDVLAVIENLAPRFSVERMKQSLGVGNVYSVVSKWVTKEELNGFFSAKTGFVLDAFDEGIIVYDPEGYLAEKKEKLFKELKQKGVVKNPKLGWVFPIKIGEKIEY